METKTTTRIVVPLLFYQTLNIISFSILVLVAYDANLIRDTRQNRPRSHIILGFRRSLQEYPRKRDLSTS